MRLRAAVTAAVTAASLLAGATAAQASTVRPHVMRPSNTDTAAAADTNVECGPPSPDPVPNGEPIVVQEAPGPAFTVGQIPASWWKTPPSADSGWQLHFRGFMWLNPLAQRAYDDEQGQSLGVLVAQMVAFHQQNPDPGTSTATTTANANKWGWDEGTTLRRLGAENCLYSLTQDPSLIPGMEADVAVQYGPRYYGPPLYMVHNHGTMADLAVIRAGDLLKRADWQAKSLNRLASNAPQAFTPGGMTKEQSSSYHAFNAQLWTSVAAVMDAHWGKDNVPATQVRAIAARANQVTAWLTEPDRHLVLIGDSSADAGSTRTTTTARTWRDDVAGVVVGRWSWTDPLTTYYTIRYGAKRAAHGQMDRGGITWSALGARILVNPGKGVFDPAGNYWAWARGPLSHNVASADGHTFVDAPVYLTGQTLGATWHSYTTVDLLYGVRHTRKLTVGKGPYWMVATDTYDGGAAFHQAWHLDPAWALFSRSTDGKRVVFKRGARTLTVTTTGAASVVKGSTRPVAGWHFPDGVTRVQAWQINVAAKGTATTNFTLT